PEIVHLVDAHRLDAEAAGPQATHHQFLAAFVQRRDRRAADQLAGELQGGGQRAHAGSMASRKSRARILKETRRRRAAHQPSVAMAAAGREESRAMTSAAR